MATKKREPIIKSETHGIFNRPGSSHLFEESYSLNYDYSQLDKDTSKQLKNQTVQIRSLYTQSLNNVIAIGKFLYNVKNNILDRGQYGDWIAEEFENPGYFTHDSASNFINAYIICEKFSEKYGGIDKLKPLNLYTIYTMSRRGVPESAQEEIIDRIQSGESLKRNEVNKIIRYHKFKRKAIEALAVDVTEEQNQQELNLSGNNPKPEKTYENVDTNPVLVEDLNSVNQIDLIIHELPKSIYYGQVKKLFNQAYEKLNEYGFLLFVCGNQHYIKEILNYYELFNLNYLSLISFKIPPKKNDEFYVNFQLLHSVLLYKGEDPYINEHIESLYESKDEVFKLINSLLHEKPSKKFFHKKHY